MSCNRKDAHRTFLQNLFFLRKMTRFQIFKKPKTLKLPKSTLKGS